MSSKRKINRDREISGASAAEKSIPLSENSFEEVDHSFFNVVNEEECDSSDSDGDVEDFEQENDINEIVQSSDEGEEESDENEEEESDEVEDEQEEEESDSVEGSDDENDESEDEYGTSESASEEISDSDVFSIPQRTETVTESSNADSGFENDSETQKPTKASVKTHQSTVRSKHLPVKTKQSTLKPPAKSEQSTDTQTNDEYADHDTSDEEDIRNTVGNIPLNWYDDYKHLGYDWDGKQIVKPPKRDGIDEFLRRIEDPDFWRTVKDPQTGQDVVLSQEDLDIIKRIGQQKIPDIQFDDYAVSS